MTFNIGKDSGSEDYKTYGKSFLSTCACKLNCSKSHWIQHSAQCLITQLSFLWVSQRKNLMVRFKSRQFLEAEQFPSKTIVVLIFSDVKAKWFDHRFPTFLFNFLALGLCTIEPFYFVHHYWSKQNSGF